VRSSLMCPSRGLPDVADEGVTKLQEDVLGLLEDAGIPTETSDNIMALIAAAERLQFERSPLTNNSGVDDDIFYRDSDPDDDMDYGSGHG
jgi:hypothetical protein